MINLNKIPPKILFITNIIVIILLITSTILLFTEIYVVKKHGGQCVNNPMGWAEKYAREEKGIMIDCSCRQLEGYGFDISKLNLTGIEE